MKREKRDYRLNSVKEFDIMLSALVITYINLKRRTGL
jgi:hypothetical protein